MLYGILQNGILLVSLRKGATSNVTHLLDKLLLLKTSGLWDQSKHPLKVIKTNKKNTEVPGK